MFPVAAPNHSDDRAPPHSSQSAGTTPADEQLTQDSATSFAWQMLMVREQVEASILQIPCLIEERVKQHLDAIPSMARKQVEAVLEERGMPQSQVRVGDQRAAARGLEQLAEHHGATRVFEAALTSTADDLQDLRALVEEQQQEMARAREEMHQFGEKLIETGKLVMLMQSHTHEVGEHGEPLFETDDCMVTFTPWDDAQTGADRMTKQEISRAMDSVEDLLALAPPHSGDYGGEAVGAQRHAREAGDWHWSSGGMQPPHPLDHQAAYYGMPSRPDSHVASV